MFNKNKGFSLIELIIGITLLSFVGGILLTITLGGVKNGKFTQNLADVTIITSQKATELFNAIASQIKSFPAGTDYVGSIDPSELITGYVDYLNESGCLIKQNTIKGISPNRSGKLGDIGNGDSGSGDSSTTLDCSRSPFTGTSVSNSLTAKFRRQWIIIKNKPNSRDITIGVVLINQINNSIIRSETLVKVDGANKL